MDVRGIACTWGVLTLRLPDTFGVVSHTLVVECHLPRRALSITGFLTFSIGERPHILILEAQSICGTARAPHVTPPSPDPTFIHNRDSSLSVSVTPSIW